MSIWYKAKKKPLRPQTHEFSGKKDKIGYCLAKKKKAFSYVKR